MLSMIEREIVDRKGWIDREEFMNMIALAQAAPGLIAVNSAIFIGWRIGGWRGVIATVLGAVLPSFLIILDQYLNWWAVPSMAIIRPPISA